MLFRFSFKSLMFILYQNAIEEVLNKVFIFFMFKKTTFEFISHQHIFNFRIFFTAVWRISPFQRTANDFVMNFTIREKEEKISHALQCDQNVLNCNLDRKNQGKH